MSNRLLPQVAIDAQKKARRHPELLKKMYEVLKQLTLFKTSIERIRYIQSEVDQAIQKENLLSSSCRKGCSFCCYHRIQMGHEEKELLKSFIPKLGEKELARGQKQLMNLENHGQWQDLDYDDRACVFLKNGECSIYQNRPFVCRVTYVQSEPLDCKEEDQNIIEPLNIDEANIVVAAYYSFCHEKTDLVNIFK